jgi:hemolysin activation/secretion protein
MNKIKYTPRLNKHPYLLSALSLSLFISANAFAGPVIPDAGQISEELKKQPALTQPSAVELLKTDEDAEASSAASSVKIKVNAINISGNSLFSNSELSVLVDDLIGSEHNFAQINASVSRISRFYRDRGYAVARAYLPAQDLKDGVIEVKVLEGIVGAQTLDNQSRLSDDRANSMLADIKAGQPLKAEPVDRAVLLLSDTPGVGGARASLQPGASVGTSDLIINLDPAKAYFGNAEFDNYGSYYTGEYRVGGALAINSPLNIGDQLTIRGLSSNKNLTYARVAYQLPIGGSGFKLGAAYSDTRYKFSLDNAQLRGSASSASVYGTYPFIRSQATNLYGTMSLEQKDLSDEQVITTDKKVRLGNFGLAGNHQDGFFGGGISAFDSSLISGTLSLDAASLAQDSGVNSANSSGRFNRLNLNLNRLQRITDDDTLSVAVSSQYADKNLNSSEKFYLGGANGVRAYPQGEAGGDHGWMVNAELRHSFLNNLQGVAFYDAGSVKINHQAFLSSRNTRSISGAGLGLNAQYKMLQIKTMLAWPLYGGQATAEPMTVDRNPRLWLQMSGVF